MKQILIVEDDALLNKMLVYNLKSASYGIASVETVKEAQEVMKSRWFDMVLLDINLPDGNGYEIAKTIREKYSDTIVIFLQPMTGKVTRYGGMNWERLIILRSPSLFTLCKEKWKMY